MYLNVEAVDALAAAVAISDGPLITGGSDGTEPVAHVAPMDRPVDLRPFYRRTKHVADHVRLPPPPAPWKQVGRRVWQIEQAPGIIVRATATSHALWPIEIHVSIGDTDLPTRATSSWYRASGVIQSALNDVTQPRTIPCLPDKGWFERLRHRLGDRGKNLAKHEVEIAMPAD